MTHCLIITTGGTAEHDPSLPKGVTQLKSDIIPGTIKTLGLENECVIDQWKMTKSMDFTDRDVDELADKIRNSPYDHIIVTHGTDFLAQNARKLSERLKGTLKTVAVTGALKSLFYADSDGHANLKAAITGIKQQSPGVHVVMNQGQWLNPEGLTKRYRGIGNHRAIDFCHEPQARGWKRFLLPNLMPAKANQER